MLGASCRMLPRWIALVAGMLSVLAVIGWQGYGLLGIKRGDFIDEGRLRIREGAVQETGMGLEQIAALHLLGNPALKPVAPPPPAELPKTDLKLVLVGAITDSDPAKASALVEADRQTKRYFVGDSIPGGATLHEVLADSIVLKRENRYETLGFPKGGEYSPQVKADMALFGLTPPGGVSAAPGAQPAQAAAQQQAPGASSPQQPAAGKGLSLRERFQRAPRKPQQQQK